MTGFRIFLLSLGVVFALGVSPMPSFANGGDFFEELSATWALGASPDDGVPYFGFVRDTRGRPIVQATVSATIKPSGSALAVQSDALGHYKIPGFDKSIDPANVEIACSKPGYRQIARDRRVQRAQSAPIEVNCTLTPVAG